MKQKTDHMLATYETSDGAWHIQMSSQSGGSWGWWEGSFDTREQAQDRARLIAEKEGVNFDE